MSNGVKVFVAVMVVLGIIAGIYLFFAKRAMAPVKPALPAKTTVQGAAPQEEKGVKILLPKDASKTPATSTAQPVK